MESRDDTQEGRRGFRLTDAYTEKKEWKAGERGEKEREGWK